eukprot:1028277-Alexandrium_andersonii.AAC.1
MCYRACDIAATTTPAPTSAASLSAGQPFWLQVHCRTAPALSWIAMDSVAPTLSQEVEALEGVPRALVAVESSTEH